MSVGRRVFGCLGGYRGDGDVTLVSGLGGLGGLSLGLGVQVDALAVLEAGDVRDRRRVDPGRCLAEQDDGGHRPTAGRARSLLSTEGHATSRSKAVGARQVT